MKKITDVSVINSLIKKHFVKGVSTNNFISGEVYVREAESENLFFSENENCLFVFRKRDGFYIMNYHIHGKISFDEDNDIKIVCEVPYKGEEKLREELLSVGFVPSIERIRMAAPNPGIVSSDVRPAVTAEADAAYDFILSNFDKYTGCIPTKDEFYCDISNNRVIICKESSIRGLLHFSDKGSNAEIRHIAVSENERRKGIAGELIKALFNLTDKRKYQVWLKKDNMAAYRLYEKYGFKPDGFKSTVFTKGI